MEEPEFSVHHLFTYSEIRAKLVQMWGWPETNEEHTRLQNEMKLIQKIIPKYRIPHSLHKKIHNME